MSANRTYRRYLLYPALVFLFSYSGVLAQDCGIIARSTLEAVELVCDATGRDQLCYGNVSIDVTLDDPSVTFEQAGDVVDVASVQTLQLRTLDYFSNQWGVALMRVQASLPDDVPENVTLLLFGDVDINNMGEETEAQGPPPRFAVTPGSASNIRLQPNTDGAILGGVPANVPLTATGRITNAAGEVWLRVEFDGSPQGFGWIWSEIITNAEGDFETLRNAARPRPGTREFGPMQAFTFKSGSSEETPCEEAPDDGIMIQTPSGVGEVSFLINEVDIQVGSTAFLGAPDDEKPMNINTLQGRVLVESQGVKRINPPGATLNVPVDVETGAASAPPELPEPYDADVIDDLGFALENAIFEFEEAFIFAQPFNADVIDDFNDYFNGENTPAAFYDAYFNDDFEDDFDAFYDRILYSDDLDFEAFGDDGFDLFMQDYFAEEFPEEFIFDDVFFNGCGDVVDDDCFFYDFSEYDYDTDDFGDYPEGYYPEGYYYDPEGEYDYGYEQPYDGDSYDYEQPYDGDSYGYEQPYDGSDDYYQPDYGYSNDDYQEPYYPDQGYEEQGGYYESPDYYVEPYSSNDYYEPDYSDSYQPDYGSGDYYAPDYGGGYYEEYPNEYEYDVEYDDEY